MWVLQKDDEMLPSWLRDNLRSTCKCGGDMENYYNDAEQITNRRCSNKHCPYMLAQRIVTACDIFKVDGIGPERAFDLVRTHNLRSVYEALPHIIPREIEVPLALYLRLAFIPGFATKWGLVTESCSTLDDCYTQYNGPLRDVLDEYKEELYAGLEFVKIKPKEQKEFKCIYRCTVMLSGTVRGYHDRNQFIAALNLASKGLVEISVSESKRKTGITALIQEADSPNRGKAECALENGIPIMTPQEFREFIAKKIQDGLRRG